MKIITLLNEKGGVGKTTLATHLAAGLALRGYRVVIVDTDPQAHTTLAVSLPKLPHFYDLCIRNAHWKHVLTPVHPDVFSPPTTQASGQLLAVAGNIESNTIAINLKNRVILRQRLQELRQHVDFIILDTSPTASALNEAIYLATDYILIPTDCESFSIEDSLDSTIRHINSARDLMPRTIVGPQILGIIPNKYRHTVLHRELVNELRETYGDLVFKPLPQRTQVPESQTIRQFLFAIEPEADITQNLWSIVDRTEEGTRHHV